jgi:hypothetical protein
MHRQVVAMPQKMPQRGEIGWGSNSGKSRISRQVRGALSSGERAETMPVPSTRP